MKESQLNLSKRTLRHYLNLRHNRSTLLSGVSKIAIRHMNHLMGAMLRLGLKDLRDDHNANRAFDLIFSEQGMSADRNSRRIVEYINAIPWEMYLCLLYVELEGYRSASRREPGLVFGPLEELLGQKAAIVNDLKEVRDKVLHPAKRIDLGDALDKFMDSGALVDGHYFQTVFDLQRRLDMYAIWLGSSLIQLGTQELTEAGRTGRQIEPGRLDLLRQARIALSEPPPVFDGTGVAPKLIIINELWDDAWARHLWDRTPVFDTFARGETTRDRIGGFGRASAASEWLARHAAPIACRSV